VAALPGGRLGVHFTNRKNAPSLFSTRTGTRPEAKCDFVSRRHRFDNIFLKPAVVRHEPAVPQLVSDRVLQAFQKDQRVT
jgi:hypothetical protein